MKSIDNTMAEVYNFNSTAEEEIRKRNERLLNDHQRELRHFTKAEVIDYLGVSASTVNRYCDQLEIDPKRFVDAAWLITIDEVYKMRDAIHESPDNNILYPFFNRKPKQKMHVKAIANQKGGTGKTICVASLASCLATAYHEKYRIGVIDADPQGTLSLFYAPDRNHPDLRDTFSYGDLLLGNYDLDEGETLRDLVLESFVSTSIPNLKILPAKESDRALEGHFQKGVVEGSIPKPYNRLEEILAAVEDDFDIILIDTPPAMTYSVYNTLYAADSLLVPISPTENDRDATLSWLTHLPVMFEVMKTHGFEGYKTPIKMALTNFDGKSTSIDIQSKLNTAFGESVMETPINSSEAIKHCAKSLTTVFDISRSEYSPKYKKPFDKAVNNITNFTNGVRKTITDVWNKEALRKEA